MTRSSLRPILATPTLVLCVLAGLAASALVHAPLAAAQAGTNLEDVAEGAYYAEPVAALAEDGVLAGTLCIEGFCPGEPIDRKTMAVWVVRVLDGADPPTVPQARFDDIDSGSFYAPFVERLHQLGVTSGCGDGSRFCPHDNVTRAQMAAFVSRAFKLPDGLDPDFADVPAEAWYAAEVAKLAAVGITRGCGDGSRFCPHDNVTRAQMATFLVRAMRENAAPTVFAWTLPSHCQAWLPDDVRATPRSLYFVATPDCPVWWSHLRGLEPSLEGITADEMRQRLAVVLPNYRWPDGRDDGLENLPAAARETIANTIERLAAEDPATAASLNVIDGDSGRCAGIVGPAVAACASSNTISFVRPEGFERWLTDVETTVHEWAHVRDFRIAPGGGHDPGWCEQMAERVRADEASGRLVTHAALLEAANPTYRMPLRAGPGCWIALIGRFEMEVPSHDRAGILELSANAQTQAWLRGPYASAEARWWAAEAAAGYPAGPRLEPPLPQAPQHEVTEPERGACDDEWPDPEGCAAPDNCYTGIHDHPFLPDTRHHHSGGLAPHTHPRWHVIIDGEAVPTDVALDHLGRSRPLWPTQGHAPRTAGTYCQYPDGRKAVIGHQHGRVDARVFGAPVSVTTRPYSPDGKWVKSTASNCVQSDTSPKHWICSSHGKRLGWHLNVLGDVLIEHTWEHCDGPTTGHPGSYRQWDGGCPTEAEYDDGDYDGDWVACGEADQWGTFWDICRATTGEPLRRGR